MAIRLWDRYFFLRLLTIWALAWVGLSLVALAAFALSILVRFPINALAVATPLLLPMLTLAATAVLPGATFLAFALVARAASRAGEPRAMGAAGVSPLRFYAPVFVAALVVTLAALPWLRTIEAHANRAYKVEVSRLLHYPEVLLPILAADPTRNHGIPLAFGEVSGARVSDLAILLEHQDSQLWVLAKAGEVSADLRNRTINLELEKGILDPVGRGLTLSEDSTLRFGSATIRLDAGNILTPEAGLPPARALTDAELTLLAKSDQISAQLGYSREDQVAFAKLRGVRVLKALVLALLAIWAFVLGQRYCEQGLGVWIVSTGAIVAFWVVLDRQLLSSASASLAGKVLGLAMLLVVAALLHLGLAGFQALRLRLGGGTEKVGGGGK